jgi:ribosome maturation protein SDO1
MTNITAKLRVKNKNFEILVDCDKAINFKKGIIDKSSLRNMLETDIIFNDHKKGLRASSSDLKEAFGTDDVYTIAEKIIKQGELNLPQEYREKMRDMKLKQVVDFLVKNCIDPRTNMPFTATTIGNAIKEAGARIDENKDSSEQALEIIKQIQAKLPIKIATKKISLTIPPEYVSRVYPLIQKVGKEREDWLNDGSLKCIVNLPAGMQMEFYDKLNNLTKGCAITQEIKE